MIRVALAALLAASPAMAQDVCGPRSDIVGRLADKFGEALAFSAMAEAGLVETFANAKSRTWTQLFTTPDGQSCVLGYGGDFEAIFVPGDPA